MQTICEMCGYTSTDEKICSNCGQQILSEDDSSQYESPVIRWGLGTIETGALNFKAKTELIKFLKNELMLLENYSILRLLKSQLSIFDSGTDEFKVVIREDYFSSIRKKAKNSWPNISFNFEPLVIETAEEANQLIQKSLLKPE